VGYEKPRGSKNGFDWSMPSSTTAIFMPVPSAPRCCCSTSAPITEGEWSSASVYGTLGYTPAIDVRRTSAGSFDAGSDTVSASSTTWKRAPMRASGIARRSSAVSCVCACTSRCTYARDEALATLRRRRPPAAESPRPLYLREGWQREAGDHPDAAGGRDRR